MKWINIDIFGFENPDQMDIHWYREGDPEELCFVSDQVVDWWGRSELMDLRIFWAQILIRVFARERDGNNIKD